jgi:hypothetical protein
MTVCLTNEQTKELVKLEFAGMEITQRLVQLAHLGSEGANHKDCEY